MSRKRRQETSSARTAPFALAVAGLVALALLHAAWGTRLDGFTIDEAFHIAAGTAYTRLGDYRLNPEHPPLVKLWVGLAMSEETFSLPPLRPLADKPDERAYAEDAVYARNSPGPVQGRARASMMAFHALLLVAFAFAARRVLPEPLVLFALGFFAIDPTVAAHVPLVMTDLPITLLSAVAVLLAVRSFRTFAPKDLALLLVALGAALATKHSALVTVAVVFGLGLAAVVRGDGPARPRRVAALAVVLLGAWTLLWATYRFRFSTSPDGDHFNRPLAAKIADVGSPVIRRAIALADGAHLVPRSYLWGLADVTRAGIEGRGYRVFAFGRSYEKTPGYLFPGLLAVKLPPALLLLSLLGTGLLLARRLGPDANAALAAMALLAAAFLAVLALSGAGYAGVRHALPVVAPLALLGAAAADFLWRRSRWGRVALGALALTCLPALAAPRTWEYFNFLGGGTAGAWRRFGDEGVDIGQRTTELIRYYHERLRPRGVVPFIDYPLAPELAERARIATRPWPDPKAAPTAEGEISGTFLFAATRLAPTPWYDLAAFREAGPQERIGNLLVFRGSFRVPWVAASTLLSEGMKLVYGPSPDPAAAEPLFARASALYPEGYVAALELGNLLLARGARTEALAAYESARAHAPAGTEVAVALAERVSALKRGETGPLRPLRNPWLE